MSSESPNVLRAPCSVAGLQREVRPAARKAIPPTAINAPERRCFFSGALDRAAAATPPTYAAATPSVDPYSSMMNPMSSSDDFAATDAIAASSPSRVAGRAGPRSLKQPSSAAFKPANMSGSAEMATPVPEPRDRRRRASPPHNCSARSAARLKQPSSAAFNPASRRRRAAQMATPVPSRATARFCESAS